MKIFSKIALMILAVLLLASLCGCKKTQPEEENQIDSDIIITEDPKVTTETMADTEKIIYDLLEHYTKTNVSSNITENTENKLRDLSAQLTEVVASTITSDLKCARFNAILTENGISLIDDLKSPTGDLQSLRKLYSEISTLMGAEGFGLLAYNITLFTYDYNYQETMRKYEKYGYTYLLEDAELIKANKEIMTGEIGEENFTSFVSSVFVFSELLLGEGFEAEGLSAFTDSEILIMISRLDLSLEISDAGWTFLLSSVSPYLNSGAVKSLATAMEKNGDMESLASVMNDFMALICSVQASLDTEDIALLRSGDGAAALNRIFSKFDEIQWARFDKICSISLALEQYDSIMLEYYGQMYADHLDSLEVVSLEMLRASVGSDKFYESLKGYLAGVMPAIPFGM